MISNDFTIEDQDNFIEVADRILLCLDSRTATNKFNGANLSDIQFNFQEPFIKPKDDIFDLPVNPNYKGDIINYSKSIENEKLMKPELKNGKIEDLLLDKPIQVEAIE
jgi:hypothetical protein